MSLVAGYDELCVTRCVQWIWRPTLSVRAAYCHEVYILTLIVFDASWYIWELWLPSLYSADDVCSSPCLVRQRVELSVKTAGLACSLIRWSCSNVVLESARLTNNVSCRRVLVSRSACLVDLQWSVSWWTDNVLDTVGCICDLASTAAFRLCTSMPQMLYAICLWVYSCGTV